MKKGLENIDEVFKQAFDGFEADVDPSVWNNIQNSIATGAGAESSTVSAGAGKSVLLKFVAGFVVLGTMATTVYYLTDNIDSQKSNEITKELAVVNNALTSVDLVNEENNEGAQDELVEADFQGVDAEEKDETTNLISEENEVLEILPAVNNTKDDLVVEDSDQGLNEEEVVSESKDEKAELINAKELEVVKQNQDGKISVGTIQASVMSGKAPLDIIFDVDGENIVSYLWDFGDELSTSNVASPFHTFNEPGQYRVKLIVLDKYANTKTLIKIINVEKNITSSIGAVQNAFSPNGDGNNDMFIIKTGQNISVFNAKVKTLNGEDIYEWNSIEQGWDGRDKSGKMMDPGAYILIVYAKGLDGVDHPINKVITITK
ncbi:MAG: PKD domain-containing protein [Vicingaceae bacterium]|nr:PKD domain-containing protein [Vicingaceae bacterium]